MVKEHLKGDIKNFKKEAHEDRELIKKLDKKPKKHKEKEEKHAPKKKDRKISKVMREYQDKELHSGSKKGPVVKKRSQALAIALSEQREADKKKKK